MEQLKVKEKEYESLQAIEKALGELALANLLHDLEQYAKFHLYEKNEHMAQDIVNTYFEKLLTYERKWYKGDLFLKTIFLGVKSLCNNQNKKIQPDSIEDSEHEVIDNGQPSTLKHMEGREFIEISINSLKKHDPPPSELEVLIFECWAEGIDKPQEISNFLEKDITEIRNGIKRLNRKMPFVKEQIMNKYGSHK